MRYVLDTCVVVSALRSRLGASNQVLRLVFEGRLPIVLHYKLVSEYHAVLIRMVDAGAVHFATHEIERFLAAMTTIAEEVEVRYLWRPNLPDESDNFIYQIAVAASPSTIITHNVRDFAAPELQLPGVSVETPQQLLGRFRRDL